MKELAISVLTSIVLAVLLCGCGPGGNERGNDPTAKAILPPVKATSRIIAEGVVLPRRYAALSVPESGTVSEVLVEEGDHANAGQVLVQLESRSQRAAVSEAEAAVQAAESSLEELKAGAREQEIAAEEAKLDGAKARLKRLLEDPRSSDLAAAQAALDESQAALDDLLDGPGDDEIASAAAERANAAAALQQAQAAYDEVKWFDGAGQLPEALQLQQATNDYEAANATYEALIAGPKDAEIAAAQARVRKAEAELEQVKQSARDSEIAEAEAEVRQSEAELDLLKAGTRSEQIAKAEADVVAAYATLRKAQAELADTELRAPFAGTVAMIGTRTGELVDSTRPVVQLADLSSWVIETDDLTEIEVVDVRPGAQVTITFDAIPDLELPGQVTWITPYGEEKEGDITYTVLVEPDEDDPRLRWNMTAVVDIEAYHQPSPNVAPDEPAQEEVASWRLGHEPGRHSRTPFRTVSQFDRRRQGVGHGAGTTSRRLTMPPFAI
jgi:HlyD family secretion protein